MYDYTEPDIVTSFRVNGSNDVSQFRQIRSHIYFQTHSNIRWCGIIVFSTYNFSIRFKTMHVYVQKSLHYKLHLHRNFGNGNFTDGQGWNLHNYTESTEQKCATKNTIFLRCAIQSNRNIALNDGIG